MLPALSLFRRPSFLAALGALSLALALAVPYARGQKKGEPSKEEQARRDQVVVKFKKGTLTVGEIEEHIRSQSPFMKKANTDRKKLEGYVSNLVRFELLAREASIRGYGKDPVVVKAVKQSSVQHLIQREIDAKVTPSSIPEDKVAAYYESHRTEFNRPELRRASHVVVADRAEAQKLVDEVRKADARDFMMLVQNRSLDSETKLRGGDLRFFTREGTPPNSIDAPVDTTLAAAAFALKDVGDVSEPIKIGENYSVLKLTGIRPAESKSLADANQSIRMRLWRDARQKAVADMVDQLKKTLKVEVYPERIEPIVLEPPPAGGGFPSLPSSKTEPQKAAGKPEKPKGG